MSPSWTILALVFILPVHADITYYGDNKGLTELPSDIPADVNVIKINSNDITTLEEIPDYPALTAFYVSSNGLTTFPDCRRVGTTLETLSLESNAIRVISTDLILPLTALRVLSIYDNPLEVLPNFGLLPLPPVLGVFLQGESFVCGRRLAEVKAAEDAGKIVFLLLKPVCSSPANLTNVPWDTIAIADMTVPDPSAARASLVTALDLTTVSVLPGISATVDGTTLVECSGLCLRSPTCGMYAYGSGGRCVVTDVSLAGSLGELSGHGTWWALF